MEKEVQWDENVESMNMNELFEKNEKTFGRKNYRREFLSFFLCRQQHILIWQVFFSKRGEDKKNCSKDEPKNYKCRKVLKESA
jgi:hypothetical protein